jgi:hypothetical protein
MLTNFNMLFRVVNAQNGGAMCNVTICGRQEGTHIILVI